MNTKTQSHFVDGDRIFLREVRLDDAEGGYYHWMNDPVIYRYLESRFKPHSVESLKDYIKSIQNDSSNLFLAIIDKEKDVHIGNIKLGPINWIHRHGDIGLIIGEKDYWGKGYATESIKLISDYAFKNLNLHKLTCGIYATNKGSIKAFEKAGFVQEGHKKLHYFCDGEYIDSFIYGLIR